jgi:dCTP deaminase
MPALARHQIVKGIRDKELVVSPILSEDQIGLSSVDLRMGNVVLAVRGRGLSHVDPKNYTRPGTDPDAVIGKRQKHERQELTFKRSFLLHPGHLVLVPTLEWIALPYTIKGFVTARSSWAREGLSIATASFIQPGYEGVITLELANLGQIPIALYPGLRIAQIAFYELGEPAQPKPDEESQFQGAFEPTEGNISKNDEVFVKD